MNYAQFLNDFMDKMLSQVQIGIPGKIINYYPKTLRADVQPIMSTQDFDGVVYSYPALQNISVQTILTGGFYIRPEYKEDDMVWITFSTFDIASALDGTQSVESTKTFSLENASISGGIAPNNFTAPNEFSQTGLLIGSTSGNAYMQFTDSAIVFNFGNGTEQITFDAQGIVTKQAIKAGLEVTVMNNVIPTPLSTHTHISAAPGSPTSPMTAGS